MSRSPMPKPIPTIHLPVAASDEPSLFDLDGGGTIEADGASSACLGGASGTGAGLGGGVTCGVDSPAGLPSSTSEPSVEKPEKPLAFPFCLSSAATALHLLFKAAASYRRLRPYSRQIGRASCRERVCQYV